MTEVLHSPSSSSPSSISTPPHNGALFQAQSFVEEEEGEGGALEVKGRDKDRDQLSLLALLVTLFRKSFWMACKTGGDELCGGGSGMEIGWPTNVRHVAHVTFDRFDGFLGLPDEFEPEVPRRAPSASATVFGVSTESMQLSYDSRGNCIPSILILMQSRLYDQGGLQAEGIFRINAENSQEEHVRDQLNRGMIPEGIDVHCLAGLIKAWFRELPRGVLDSLSPESVIQCQSEEDCTELVRLLPPSEAALLDWAINLMADVVHEEHLNKMNSRNIAMVFAPNMTQMADPLTALMYAVQVMNFLKTLIEKAIRDRENTVIEPASVSDQDPYEGNGHESPSQLLMHDAKSNEATENDFVAEEPDSESASDFNLVDNISDEEYLSYSTSTEESDVSGSSRTPFHPVFNAREAKVGNILTQENCQRSKTGQSSDNTDQAKVATKTDVQEFNESKGKGVTNLSRINSMTERIEAWR